MKYGTNLASNGVAYTFDLPNVNALKNTFITDITKVTKTNFGKEVTLKFKNLGSKVRMAIYETVPGYSIKDVKFYQVDGTNTDLGTATKYDDAYLIGDNNNSFPTNAKISVYFPHVGYNNDTEADYDKAAATVVPATGSYDKFKTFGALTDQLVAKERAEAGTDNVFLGRDLPHATFAGDEDAAFYETVFPVSTAYPLTLRVDYTLVPIDGAAETIKVYGARAVVPSTYTKWLPNYAYTYIFKISDNTNGWTSTVTTDPAGLFPITFDAVVTEATEATGEQTTITTVATPTITTYQQNHTTGTDEYSKAATGPSEPGTIKDLYVQVMDNSTAPATLKGDLNGTVPSDDTDRSLLYVITGSAPISEATVMDALENQSAVDGGTGAITGRNGMILTPNANIDATVTTIVNGPDNNPITKIDIAGTPTAISAGQVAKINMTAVAAGTYAYVYDYSTAGKTETNVYQPIAVEVGTTDVEGVKYISNTALGTWDDETTAAHYTSSSENAAAGYLYFSITTNGGASKTYSFISVDDKIGTPLPDGLLKLPAGQLSTGAASEKAAANTFYFTIYKRNDGKYAVKVIKIVA